MLPSLQRMLDGANVPQPEQAIETIDPEVRAFAALALANPKLMHG